MAQLVHTRLGCHPSSSTVSQSLLPNWWKYYIISFFFFFLACTTRSA